MNKLQNTYERIIKLANINYKCSSKKLYAALHSELSAKVEAYESAADCLLNAFPNQIKKVDTMRFVDIRKQYLSESDDQTHKIQTENADTILSSHD